MANIYYVLRKIDFHIVFKRIYLINTQLCWSRKIANTTSYIRHSSLIVTILLRVFHYDELGAMCSNVRSRGIIRSLLQLQNYWTHPSNILWWSSSCFGIKIAKFCYSFPLSTRWDFMGCGKKFLFGAFRSRAICGLHFCQLQ